MIHLIDHENLHIYSAELDALRFWLRQEHFDEIASPISRGNKLSDGRLSYAMERHPDGSISGCLQLCRLRDAPIFDAAAAGVEGTGVWVRGFARSIGAPWRLGDSPRVLLGVLESVAAGPEPRLLVAVDHWYFAWARRRGLPWRQVQEINSRLVIAALDVDAALVERIADQIGVALPCAYHVDDQDMAAWGTLSWIEQEFAASRKALALSRGVAGSRRDRLRR